ncbi:GntP family permease [Sesbania bispinosa]|nr:GntP family permease [Sesbania bispinosa]
MEYRSKGNPNVKSEKMIEPMSRGVNRGTNCWVNTAKAQGFGEFIPEREEGHVATSK